MSVPFAPEKRATAHWVRCPSCRGWFHVTASLLARVGIKLHCPHCHTEFAQSDATRISKGG